MQLTPTILLILDGWGQSTASPANAVTQASTPNLDSINQRFPKTLLNCSGRDVGLPTGFIGNSEVGHMNIGAGRIVYQDMTRIEMSIEQGDFLTNPVLQELLQKTVANKGRLHLMGLLSDGGVHSHNTHIYALLEAAKQHNVPVILHVFTDGRDTSPTKGVSYIQELEATINRLKVNAHIGTISGRYYAMDRDKHWERTKQAFDLIVHGIGPKLEQGETITHFLQESYAANISDEFVVPHSCCTDATLHDGDSIFFWNFRADRARQLVQSLILADFNEFDRGTFPRISNFASMTRYESSFPMPVAFDKEPLQECLGDIIAQLDEKQLRIAETEKYAHVTYFFNGGREEAFPQEERILIPSPRDVSTYDQKPQMSVQAVTDALLEALEKTPYTFVVCNFANMDMVGHSGNIPATIEAVTAVDSCLGRLLDRVLKNNWRLILTADHGNAEMMLDEQGKPFTSHTLNPVQCSIIDVQGGYTLRSRGRLADIAPTILSLWNRPIPAAMTGTSLVTSPQRESA